MTATRTSARILSAGTRIAVSEHQSSIEDQFEFLQARWINDASRPKSPGGSDMLIGQNAATAGGVARVSSAYLRPDVRGSS